MNGFLLFTNMNKLYNKLAVLILMVLTSTVYSQISKTVEKNTEPVNLDDFKVLISTNNNLEIEYTPHYIDNIHFVNEIHNTSKDFGSPDLGYRSFPIFLPSDKNNVLQVLEVKYEEITNVDVPPVPTPVRSNDLKSISFIYERKQEKYSYNGFLPKEPFFLVQGGIIRGKFFGNAVIYPIQYNPATKTTKRVTYIKFRVSFGNNPIFSPKKLSNQEIQFLYSVAINAGTALNWTNLDELKTSRTVINSVLATGDFYKIEVKEPGIYILTKSFLQSAGINVNNIDPRTIKIYNNGGFELPYSNSEPVPEDLVENKIYVEGESDGKFDDNDYILFYGAPTYKWNYSPITNDWTHQLNHYSNSNYYFLTFGGAYGQRMQIINSPNQPNIPPLQSVIDKSFIEPELNNLGSTGTLWVSQRIGVNETFTFTKSLPGYIEGSPIKYRLRLGNATSIQSVYAYYQVKDDNSSYSALMEPIDFVQGFSRIKLRLFEGSYVLFPNTKAINLKASLPSQYNSPYIIGYYDYLELFYNRSLSSAENNYIQFTAPDTNSLVEFQVSPFTSATVRVFDISNPLEPKIIVPISYSNGTVRFQDNLIPQQPKEFIVTGENYKTPVSISSRVPNQNLHGITDGATFVIISPTEFLPAANRLKSLREAPGPGNPDYLKTLIVDINQIYNEFSCGKVDPVAVRNFLKYAYNNWNERPVYVLFLGDGTYDYKNIYNLSGKNFLPPIEKSSDESSDLESYPSDDFATEINENYYSPTFCRPDFAWGRICVNSLSEANTVIDKISAYESPSNYGIWKKKIMYVADDGWTTENNQGQEGSLHTSQSELVAEIYTPPDIDKEKIYIVTYPAIITPQGRRKPGANIDIINGWNEGRLVINYVGHGSTDLWAHEHIFVRDESIPQLNNKDKYPMVTIASCDLARYDDPFALSAGEQLVFIDNKGAIGVVAASRPVYANDNSVFNNKLWENFMFRKDTLRLPIRMGLAMYNTKNQLYSVSDNDMKYLLVGDPTLRVSIPQYITRIDSINGIPTSDTAVVKALQKMRISGSILKPDSSFWNNYNGDIIIKVNDVAKDIVMYDFGYPFYFRLDGGTIFKGKSKIVNGKWEIEFVVPKDISFATGTGKLIAYFYNNNTEGSGYTNMFKLSGLDNNAPVDTTGPVVSLFLDSRNFRTGDMVNQNTKLIADIFDESGINLTGTLGHRIEAILNNDESKKIDLTSFYNTVQGYQYGTIEYNLEGLPEGPNNLKLKVWDTYNNFSTSSIDFYVKSTTNLVIDKVYNYPNPMKDFTSFTFQHNFSVPLTAQIKIYTVSGKKIKDIIRNNITDKFVIIDWDGKDNDGDYIANGIYIYKIIIKTEDGTYSTTSTGKIAKLK